MGFFDFLGGPSKTDLLYEELVELRKLKSAHGKEESQKLMDKFYYLSTIFLAFGRKKEYTECIDHLYAINPSGWILEHKKLADLSFLTNAKIRFAFPELKLQMTSLLLAEGKISVQGQVLTYPDKEREDLTKTTEHPCKKYKKHCKPLTKEIIDKAIEYHIIEKSKVTETNKETAKELAKYILDNPIETHRALTQIGIKNKNYVTDTILEQTKYNHELFEKTKGWKKEFYQDKSEDVNTKDYARGVLGLSYYFLVVGIFDKFTECLEETEDGSREYNRKTGHPKNPEWVRKYHGLANRQIQDQTRLVFEQIYPYLAKIMRDEKNYMVGIDGLMHPKKDEKGRVILDEAIGPETPLHESETYGRYLEPITNKAEELYESAGLPQKEAKKYAELLAKYLLDYPMKAYSATLKLYLAKTGQSYTLAYG